MAKILVVDALDGDSIRATLKNRRHGVSVVSTAADALTALPLVRPDLIVMDHLLPDWSGLMLQPMIGYIPLILLSASDDQQTRVMALRGGADDFIAKPYDDDDLLARIDAVLRRTRGVRREPTIDVGPVSIAYGSVRVDGKPVPLTKTEQTILTCLALSVDKVVSRYDVMMAVYGGVEGVEWHAIASTTWRLRGKLRAAGVYNPTIQTMRGMGLLLSYAQSVRAAC